MKTSVNLNFLRIPMGLLYDLENVEAYTGLAPEQATRLSLEYSDEELKGIRQALEYASQHPEHDFKALLPDLPRSNVEISKVLKQIHLSMPE
jgi:CHAT domain-containing protein